MTRSPVDSAVPGAERASDESKPYSADSDPPDPQGVQSEVYRILVDYELEQGSTTTKLPQQRKRRRRVFPTDT
jgi:hypothetical protein